MAASGEITPSNGNVRGLYAPLYFLYFLFFRYIYYYGGKEKYLRQTPFQNNNF